MKADSISEISILVPRLIPIVTFAPYLNELYRRGIRVHAYGPAEVLSALSREVPSERLVLHDWSVILQRRKWQQLLHALLMFALTPKDFSLFWPRFVELSLSRYRGIKKIFLQLALVFPFKCRANRVNYRLDRLFRRISKNPFITDTVIATTTGGAYHLLASRGLKKVSLLESWDQPTKHPLGYYADSIHVWSQRLQLDWEVNQGAAKVVVGYPTKLNYLFQRKNSPSSVNSSGESVWMYPAAFCQSSLSCYYEDECRLIQAIASATEDLGVKLFVKPKPNGTPGEFDDAIRGFSHVLIGVYQEHCAQADYLLTQEYNDFREKELLRCNLLINSVTTFAYEGAIIGLPVVQLRSLKGGDYSALEQITHNYHLQEYILKDDNFVQGFRTDEDIRALMVAIAQEENDVLENAASFSMKLKDFIEPEISLSLAVQAFVDDCESYITRNR